MTTEGANMNRDLELWLTEEKEASRAEGKVEGEARFAKLLKELMANGRSQDAILALNNPDARQKFYQEFHIE